MNSTALAGSQALPAGELDWLMPARLYCSDSAGGVSSGPWSSNNLGHHVDDSAAHVAANRARLLRLPGLQSVQWLNQIHGTGVIHVERATKALPSVDAMWTARRGIGLAILTADCLPVMVADTEGAVVGAAHAGWRGLCGGVLASLLRALPVPASRLQAFIGPAIGQPAFEVGAEVVTELATAGFADCVEPSKMRADRFQVDLIRAAGQQLQGLGVSAVSGGHWCTYTDRRFYSWRRETHRAAATGQSPVTGRQASLIWLPKHGS